MSNILIGIFLGWLMGVIFGCCVSSTHWKEKAVAKKKAEYYLDAFNVKKWRWLK